MKWIELLFRINNNHGRGDISKVIVDNDQSKMFQNIWTGTVVRRFPGGMENDERKWTVKDGVLTFLGVKRKI